MTRHSIKSAMLAAVLMSFLTVNAQPRPRNDGGSNANPGIHFVTPDWMKPGGAGDRFFIHLTEAFFSTFYYVG